MPESPNRWQSWATITIILLSTASSLLGLFRPGHYRDPEGVLPALYAQDLTILLIGVPVLTVGLWYSRRGSLRGHLLWIGGLSYMAYLWATVSFSVAWNEFFLGYVTLLALSLITLISGIVSTDEEAIYRGLHGRISPVVYSLVLWVIALGLAMLWLLDLVPAMVEGTPPPIVQELGEQMTVSHVIDLAVVVPASTIAGYWLWQNRPWGYVFAGIVLLLGALLAPTITAMTIVLVLEGDITVPRPAIVFTLLPVVLAAALAIRYLLAVGSREVIN